MGGSRRATHPPFGIVSLQGGWGTGDSTMARQPGPESAAEQDTRIEALVAEALNLLFEKHGKPAVA